VGFGTAQGACETGVTSESGSVPLYGAHGRMASEHEGEDAVGIKLVVVKVRKSAVGRDGRDGRGAVKLDPIMATRSVGGHLIACEGVEGHGTLDKSEEPMRLAASWSLRCVGVLWVVSLLTCLPVLFVARLWLLAACSCSSLP
jgi:hypothetical protein